MKEYPSTELARGSWLDYLLLHGTGELSGDPKTTSSVIEPLQQASTPGMTPWKVVFVGLILEGLMPILHTVS